MRLSCLYQFIYRQQVSEASLPINYSALLVCFPVFTITTFMYLYLMCMFSFFQHEDVDRQYFGNTAPSRLNPRMPKPVRTAAEYGVGFGPGQFFEGGSDMADLGSLDDVNNSRLKSLLVEAKPRTPMDLIQEDFPSTPSAVYSNRGLLSAAAAKDSSGRYPSGAPSESSNAGGHSSPPPMRDQPLSPAAVPPTPQSPTSNKTTAPLTSLRDDISEDDLPPIPNNASLTMAAREFVPHKAQAVDPMIDQAALGMAQMSVNGGVSFVY